MFLLNLCPYLFSLHSTTKKASSARPSGTPRPAPIATSLFDDGDDDGDDDGVASAVTVMVVGWVLLGDVEPDVLLKMTKPASMPKGAVLPLVPDVQAFVVELNWSQQNKAGGH